MDALKIHISAITADNPISVIADTKEKEQYKVINITDDDAQKTIPMSSDIIIRKGYSPFINDATDTWYVYDNKRKVFYDTGVVARGGVRQDLIDQIQKNQLDIQELMEKEEIDPTVPDWAKEEDPPTYSAEDVEAVDREDTITESKIDLMFLEIFGH